MKRLLIGLLVLLIPGLTLADGIPFKDMGKAPWAQTAVTSLAQKGVLRGTGPDTFSPSDSVTRAQVAVGLARLLSLKDGDTTALATYSDGGNVPTWAEGPMAILIAQGIIHGDNGSLEPNQSATRAEVVTMLIRGLGLGSWADQENGQYLNAPDGKSVPGWARGAFAVAITEGLMQGDGQGNLNPGHVLTRAEFAVLLYRADGWLTNEKVMLQAQGSAGK